MTKPKAPPPAPPEDHAIEVLIGSVIENPRNPRAHPEDQVEMLAASIKKFGQRRAVLARADNRMLIAGHGVHKACVRAGLATIRVVLWDVDQKTADAYMLADNQLGVGARDDRDRAAQILRDIPAADYAALGFDAEEAEKMIHPPTVDELEVTRIETEPVRDRFWISVRGNLEHQARALAHLRELMATTPGLEVELGTIEE